VERDKTSYVLAKEAVKRDTRETRQQQIQNLLSKLGGASTHALVDACVAAGIFTEEDKQAAWRPVFAKAIRDALSAADANGLPFAGQTCDRDDDGQVVWKQRLLWTVDAYQLNIQERVSQRNENHVVAVRMATECERRLGVRIPIPGLPPRRGIV
jgi:hypothetical protein